MDVWGNLLPISLSFGLHGRIANKTLDTSQMIIQNKISNNTSLQLSCNPTCCFCNKLVTKLHFGQKILSWSEVRFREQKRNNGVQNVFTAVMYNAFTAPKRINRSSIGSIFNGLAFLFSCIKCCCKCFTTISLNDHHKQLSDKVNIFPPSQISNPISECSFNSIARFSAKHFNWA